MATVVDALVVTLGLDAKGFKKGTEETEKSLKATASASVRFAKEMEASGKQAAQVFSAIKMEALGLIGVLSGTLASVLSRLTRRKQWLILGGRRRR
jgi:hypothetical protein